ncbi:CHAT domain-containing protein [Oscillatoria sp. FACHB-1407]|uniref:CHAT domain-containing protein n=1 Tax=Oscillatoria sp. FACHB-1407 TaxID=2692847 RepID=UPI0016854041|nr:CHAT domain-containing protein [Oscillatoria sp. FACHB-1407]MBD2461336.1 CHAT domain-containing protein [Oscillatoria sp. FACHB-1407]
MKSIVFNVGFVIATGLQGAIALLPAHAEPVPTTNGTDTRVQLRNGRFDIEGGRLSGDRASLFHEFEQFGLSASEIANFISNPEIRNILSRVTGGNASYIDGLLQVSGGNSNLYLINPAGILFGPNARLDLPASFTATTATGIGFGDTWLNAIGTNNYEALVGDPNAFSFATAQPGAIVNTGDLAVSAGQSLMLLGGTVINTGMLSAPGGTITIAAIPGENRVRVSQEGALLSLELEALEGDGTSGNAMPFTPLSLPELLTGGELSGATGISVNPDGTVRLTGSENTLPSNPGTVVASGTLNASSTDAINRVSAIPQISVLGDRVALVNATLNASGTNGGGTVRVGGDYQGRGTVFNASRTFVDPNSVINADAIDQGDGGQVIIWADEVTGFYGDITARGGLTLGNGGFVEVSGREHLLFRGDVDTRAFNGVNGTLLLDPTNIIIANGTGDSAADGNNTFSGNNSRVVGSILSTPLSVINDDAPTTIFESELEGLPPGTPMVLQATNDIVIGELTPNPDPNFDGSDTLPRLLINRSITFVADADNNNDGSFIMEQNGSINSQGNISVSGFNIIGGILNTSRIDASSGSITLRARNNISISELDTTVISNGADNTAGNVYIHADNDITITNRIRSWSTTDGATVELSAGGNITLPNSAENGGGIQTFREGQSNRPRGDSGDIILNSGDTINIAGRLDASNSLGSPGDIILTAQNDITTGDLSTERTTNAVLGNAGNIRLESFSGSINTSAGSVLTSSIGNGGTVILSAPEGIITGTIDASAVNGSGGNVSLNANTENIIAGDINSFSQNGNGGNVTLTASQGDITTEAIDTRGAINTGSTGNSGAIRLTSGGNINTTGGALNTSSQNGDGGNIALTGNGTIQTGALNSSATNGRGGAVTLTSSEDSINTSAGQLSTSSINGDGGAIALTAIAGSITTGDINSSSSQNGNGGTLTLIANSTIQTGALNSSAVTGQGGAIALTTEGDITLGGAIVVGSSSGSDGNGIDIDTSSRVTFPSSILTQGASVSVNNASSLLGLSTDSTLNTNGGDVFLRLASSATLGDINILTNGGAFNLFSSGALTIDGTVRTNGGNIAISGSTINATDATLRSASINQPGGNIALTATGDIRTGVLNAFSRQQAGGNINVTSNDGSVTSSNINTFGAASGGDVRIDAENNITTGRINSSSTQGNGGDVKLDPINIQVTSINAQGGTNGTGGNVTAVASEFFTATGSFRDRNGTLASISTAGGLGGGNITIIHDSGEINNFNIGTNFEIDDSGTNGTVAAITSGDFTISSGSFPYTFVEGNIQLITDPSPEIRPQEVDSLDDELPPPSEGQSSPAEDTGITRLPEPETRFTNEFEQALGIPDTPIRTIEYAQSNLFEVERSTGVKPALLYVHFVPAQLSNEGQNQSTCTTLVSPQSTDQLALSLITSTGQPICQRISGVTRTQVQQATQQLLNEITNPAQTGTNDYLAAAQQLYQWFIAPVEANLQAQGIESIAFIPDINLRSVPFATLYNGQQFLIERYSIGLMPSFSLTDTRYVGLNNAQVLAMGASDFVDPSSLPTWISRETPDLLGETPLPAVPIELDTITQEPWQSLIFLNNSFVTENLSLQLALRRSPTVYQYPDPFGLRRSPTAYQYPDPFSIVHLATHANFDPSVLNRSYIQFRNQRLRLEQLQVLNLSPPSLELLVLSACKTALGSEEAEFGFAGIAVKAGSKSALASLWNASDLGSLLLMREFYQQLGNAPTKAEALRRAQTVMLNPIQLATSLEELQQELDSVLESDRNQFSQQFLNRTRSLQESENLSNEEIARLDEEIIRLRSDLFELNALLSTDELRNDLLNKMSHPFYWSTYTIIGSPW